MSLIIAIDSREKTPFNFPTGTQQTIKALATGDYSIVGLEDYVAYERKELQDLIGCCGQGRTRFKKELHRLQAYRYRAVIIEATLDDLHMGKWYGQLKPSHIIGSICSWSNKYEVPFWLASDADKASHLCFTLLNTAYDHLNSIIKGFSNV